MKSAYWLIIIVLAVAVYVFSSGGFNLSTISAFAGWTLAGLGVLAFIGGARRNGIIAFIIGLLVCNLPNLLR